jgi:hypothetical protein
MFTCFNATISKEISLISAIHQKLEKEVPEPSPLEKCIGSIAVCALEVYVCTQFMCGKPTLYCTCCTPVFLLDSECNPLEFLSKFVFNPALLDTGLQPVGFKKSECCRIAKVAGLTMHEYTKEKCCLARSSIISKDVRYDV